MADVRKEKQEQKRQRKAETNQKKADNLARAPGILNIKRKPFRPKPKPTGWKSCPPHPTHSKKACQLNKYIAALSKNTFQEAEKTIKNLPTFRGHLEAENNEFLIRLQKAFVKFSDREDANVREMIERDSPRIRERVLWEMFHLAPSNPVNEVLPSAFALKEEKIHLLETMKNSAI